MPLNKTSGNMYPWITHTWNPIKGACPHGCSYCYMHKIYKRFGKTPAPPHLDEKEMRTYLGKGNYIFIGSSCDIFAKDIPEMWIRSVMHHADAFSENRYLLQTKNPCSILENLSLVPGNTLFCVTLESNRNYHDIYGNIPYIARRVLAFSQIKRPKMITIEPILDFDTKDFIKTIKFCGDIQQVNIGADSGNNHLPEPPAEKIRELIEGLRTFTRVVEKSNLRRLLK